MSGIERKSEKSSKTAWFKSHIDAGRQEAVGFLGSRLGDTAWLLSGSITARFAAHHLQWKAPQ